MAKTIAKEAKAAETPPDGQHVSKKVKLDHVATDASKDPQQALRAERKRAKELAKLARREAESATPSSDVPTVGTGTDSQDDPEAARRARKAEKKRLKRSRLVESRGSDAQNGSGDGASTTKAGLNGHERPELGRKSKKKEKRASENGNGVEVRDAAPSGSSEGLKDSNLLPYSQSAALSAVVQSEVDGFLSKNLISIEDGTTSDPLRPIMNFSHLPSDASRSLTTSFPQFQTPTAIQSASWPFALAGRDVIGVAETGSGKTIAFGLPCLRHVLAQRSENSKKNPTRAVIVSPTRELAVQIHEQMTLLAKPAGIGCVCVYGGVPKDAQRAALKTASIVIATPGRLNDLVEEGAAKLGGVTYVVLDEADRMLDKGFEDAIRQIITSTATNTPMSTTPRQTLMFTATWPPSVRELAATFMNTPARVVIGDSPSGELRANVRITQRVEVVDPRDKERRLVQLLKEHQSGAARDARILVFCLYKKEAARVEASLHHKGFRVAGIHGDLSQDKRSAALERFKSGQAPVLVATDVAARGLDIPAVKAVINVTFPLTVEDYVHRIGRTGRAGAEGLAITLFTEHDKPLAGGLVNVLKAAKQDVPESLLKFGTAVKRKQHDAYGAFYKDTEGAKKATKITFDD